MNGPCLEWEAIAHLRLIADRYEVAEVIGRGAMGEVRAGHDRRLDRDVAIKILRADMAAQPSTRQRFEDEARLAARLVHPHVVAMFDSGEDTGGVPYLVMERLSGRTLADDIAAGPLDWEVVRTVGLQLLDALGAAHAAGVVHRDVKPGNVLAATPGCWKVGDFGIAKSLELSDQNLTIAGTVIGTPSYLAPERLAGGPATVSSDLYAAGVVLYEALTGRRPVEEGAPLAALLTAAPIPVTDLRPDTPAPLVAVVTRAMARNPADRFATAAEMATALQKPLPGPPVVGTVTVTAPIAAPMTPTQVLTEQLPTPNSPASLKRESGSSFLSDPRRRIAVAAMAAVAIVVVVILAIGLSGHHRGAPTTATPTTQPAAAVPAGPAPAGPVPAPLDAALQRLEREVRP